MRQVRILLSWAWSLAIPYWRSEERWRAAALLCAVIILNITQVVLTVLMTYWQSGLVNALSGKDWDLSSRSCFGGAGPLPVDLF